MRPTSTPDGKTFWSPTPWLFGLSLLLFLAEIIWRRLPTRTQAPTGSRVATAAIVLLMSLSMGQQANAQDDAQDDAQDNLADIAAKISITDTLAKQTNALINDSLKTGVDRAKVDKLFRSALLADGNTEKLLSWLTESRGDINEPRGQVIAEVEVHIASQRGDLQRAADVLADLLKVKAVSDKRADLQIWHAKLYDALGDVTKARALYEALAKRKLGDAEQQSVRLRLSLMGLIGDKDKTKGAKPLIELAKKSKDVAFRNRAAIVLAVQDQAAEAIKLFTIQGKGTVRFRNASRVTEWAIRAKNRDKAINSAWVAVDSAELKRDRNYALSLLVESYRLKEATKGLEELVKKLTEKNDANEAMADEVRVVWISLLRELGRYDDAIKLFKSTADDESGFTIEMRRELLEMEGEAGNEDRMIQSYRELIKSEPKEMTWRSGLTQILLEKGQDAEARALWTDFVNESTSGTALLISAQTLGEFGMDDLAKTTIERMVQLKANQGQALLYWSDLQQRRGNVDLAEQTLNRIQAMDDVADEVRAELASSFERIGRQDKAIEVNEAIRASRDTVAEDLELRLAWLYSEIGDEEKAQEQWLALWRKINSIPRRRYVEDRLMTVASRLGTLADIAIDLEEKLADGTADAREAGLLVRIYSRVNDSVAATEISEEYMASSGKNQVEQLQEKGRIYQICNDYWNYEKVVEELIEVDPAGKTEYLRQLALSMLERGKAQEARAVLMTLRSADDGKDSIGGEFEAGVLSLVGMNAEAASAYRKGIATYPDRIESYLLLANLLKGMGQTDRAVGMFQYLAENAERDDLFTIAIDGLLNMEADKKTMQWARRITLERLAGREDKNYLYQLLSDLSSEVNDKSGQIRAMENSLAVSGTRRLSVLRECMELSSKIRGGVYYSSSSRGPTNKGNEPFFAFGRRLIGLGELMPPQVFLDLGQAFLDDGNTASAERTFAMARNLADPRSYQREVAVIFEKANKIPEALVRYDKLLRTSPSDVALIARVAKLNERESKDDAAFRFYQRGLNLLISQTPLTTEEEKKQTNRFYSSNRDAYQMYSDRLMKGLVVTMPDDQTDKLIGGQMELLTENLKELERVREQGRDAKKLTDSPRIDKRTSVLRGVYFALGQVDDLESLNALLIKQFPDDKILLSKFAKELASWGRYDSIERMLETQNPDDDQRQQLLVMLGRSSPKSKTGKLSPKEMWQRFLPVWMDGDDEAAKKILRRVDQTKGRAPGQRPGYVIVNGMAVMQNAGSSANVAPWMRLALAMGDEGLALQFARSRLKTVSGYGSSMIASIFATYETILPEEPFADLVRYAANLYKEDKNRLTDYLWLVSKHGEHLGNDVLDDEEILKRIEDSTLQIGYRFPFTQAMEILPESIRGEAIAEMLDRIAKKSRPRELMRIPFSHDKPIDEESAKALLESFESGIEPAIQDNYLRQLTYYLPRNGTAVTCPDNAQLAISMLDVLMTDKVRKREETIPKMAEYIKAVVLHQSGDTDAALEMVLDSYEPKATISDYYLRYSRDWAYRELIPDATDRFVDLIDKKIKDGKPTVKQTDERLVLIKQANDESTLRATYQRAIKDHPKESKYVTAYERWEQTKKRPFAVIDLHQNRLTAAKESKDASVIATTQAKLASLLMATNNLPKAMPHWLAKDDADIKQFETQEKQRTEALKVKKPNAKKDAKDVAKKVKVKTDEKAEKKKKEYKLTMTGVKQAIDDKDLDAAQQTIRKMWRTLPAAEEPRYNYNRSKRLNGLTWPSEKPKPDATKTNEPKKEKSEEEKLEAEQKARLIARGGLATFTPKERPTPKKSTKAWTKLAEYPFAVNEMHRIMRSQSSPAITNVQDISIGLLQVARNKDGDKATFASLVQQLRDGHVSNEILVRFFAMLEDDQTLINADNESVIDVLLSRLDLTNANRATQLADLCSKVGQHERAAALYRHCALLTTDNRSGSITGLIAQAKKTYSGEQLMKLVESMFELTNQNSGDISQMLDLRSEILDAKEAADRSRPLFEGEITATNTADMGKLVRAVSVFARNGEHELAAKCLTVALSKYGKPLVPANFNPYYGSSNSRNVLRLSRGDIIRMFPADPANYKDNKKWLAKAVTAVLESKEDEETKPEIIVETFLTIAIRQCEGDDKDAAAETLSYIDDDWIAKSPQHESLAIDVMRLAGNDQQALNLQTKIHSERRLSHLRFGDLLRDKNEVDGSAAAVKLLSELTELSMDKDLLAAAEEIAADDEVLSNQVKELKIAQETAQKEYDTRRKAAKKRAETKQQWQVEDKSKKLNKPAKALNATNATSAAKTIRAAIMKLATPKP